MSERTITIDKERRMKKRISMTAILAGSLMAAVIPGAASAEPVGDCPVDTGAVWTLTSVSPDPADTNVGTAADQNGDGYLCVRINPAGKFVWRDNSNPPGEL